MRVLLAQCLAFERFADGAGGRQYGVIDNVGCRPRAAISGIHQLENADCRLKRQRSKVEQARRSLDLAVFKCQSVAFHQAEDLFDAPAQPVEPDDVQGLFRCVRGLGGEKPPSQWPFIDFARLDAKQLEACWHIGGSRGGALDDHCFESPPQDRLHDPSHLHGLPPRQA